ncbi:erythromycin esterase family protein [Kushneria sp. AK178]
MTARRPETLVADILERCPLVGLGEIHWCPQVMAGITTLLESPALEGTFDDIVVEFGSARHQAWLDRYIRGETMDDAALAAVWRDTLYFLLWSPPVYAEFFRRLRAVNLTRSPERRVRVVLAEPAIDWATLNHEAFACWHEQRESAYVERIEQEVLAYGRRAVLVFGLRHLTHHGPAGSRFAPLGERLARRYPGVIELIHPYHEEKGVFSGDCPSRDVRHNGLMTPASFEASHGPAMIDHLWHLGALERRVALPDDLFADTDWLATVVARLQQLGDEHLMRARRMMTASQQAIFEACLARHVGRQPQAL